jgi:ABC-type sulfate/molybdate transport systems ATPase subunit
VLRALAAAPEVLVLDEPTESLDRDSAVRVARALRRRCEEQGVAIACVTHDRAFAASFGDAVLEMGGGRP